MPKPNEVEAELIRRGAISREQVIADEVARRQLLQKEVSAQQPEELSILDDLEQRFQQIPGASVLSEFASAANKSIADVVDFFGPDAINSVLELAGVEKRVPTASETLESVGVGTGEFMEPGIARDVVRGAGEVAPVALGAGQALRTAAERIPAIVESAGANITRQLGGSTAVQDVTTGALAGAGAEVGGAVGQEAGGDIGEAVGRNVGALAAPLLSIVPATSASGAATRALKQSAPTTDALRTEAKAVYKQIDDMGVTVAQPQVKKLAEGIASQAKKQGLDPDVTPTASGVVNRILKDSDDALTVSEIDTLRKVADGAASNIGNRTESAIGNMIKQKIDEFLDDIPDAALRGAGDNEVGALIRQARDLTHRQRKGEALEEVFENARNQASGFENGLRTQLRSLLKSPKRRRGFNQEELDAMRQVVRGGKAENIAKFLGKFGMSEGQSTNALMALLGGGLGGSIGAAVAGPVGAGIGAVTLPVIGQTAKTVAQRLTNNNAEIASALVRSGKNGRAIIAAYMRAIPKGQRNVEELTGLLLHKGLSADALSVLKKSENTLVANAAYFASVINAAPIEEEEDAALNEK